MSEFLEGYNEINDVLDTVDFVDELQGGDGFTPAPVKEALGPINFGLDAVKGMQGAEKFEKADEFHPQRIDGLHDMIDGGTGMLGESDSTVGKLAKSFNTGFTIGDKLAPVVYGDEPTGASKQPSPVDHIYYPTTGNDTVDWLFGVGAPEQPSAPSDGKSWIDGVAEAYGLDEE